MTASPLPIIRLKPKIDPLPIRRGAPWVFADELVTDRRTKKLNPGDLAILEDANRLPLALVSVNLGSKIIARVLDTDLEAVIDAAWIEARMARALALRERVYDTPFYRLVHAEADGFPGVIIDRFGDIAVVQPNAAWADARMDLIEAALIKICGVTTVMKNAAGRARSLEGLDDVSMLLRGNAVEAAVPVPMNGATYMADLIGGQKTGIFFDQRPNHAFAAALAKGGRVLDVFSHVGGFSLAALAAGATSALAVDGSQAALDLAEAGAAASGFSDQFETRKGDAFKTMEALDEAGSRFDVVVADPPAFAPGKKDLGNGLRAYSRTAMMASKLVEPGGYLVLCSCSHAADLVKFRQASLRGISRAGRKVQILHTGSAGIDHPTHPALAESGYLKAIFLRLD
ncbi:MAG: class I SAM-dependent rRNA methyltransferase [Litoreibacter sp.]